MTAVAPAPKKTSIEDDPTIHQARQKLDMAYRYKNFMPNKTLQTCDEILAQWPQSQEAEEAKELIKSICKRKSTLRKQRQREGKYTGD